MKKTCSTILALLLVFSMILPMTVSAVNVYDVTVSITDTGSTQGEKENYTVTDTLTYQSGSAKMVEVLAQIVLSNYENLRLFRSQAMQAIMDEGLAIAGTTGSHLASAWSTYANMNLIGNASLIAKMQNYDLTVNDYGVGTYTISLQNTVSGDAKNLVTYTVTFTISRHDGYEEITVPVSTDENEYAVEVTVQLGDDSAKVLVNSEEIESVVESSEENNTPTYITVDLSCLEDEIGYVVIDTDILAQIAEVAASEENNVVGLEITMPNGTQAAFDAQVLEAVVEQANGDEIILVITMYEVAAETLNAKQQAAVEEMDEAIVIEAYFMCNNVRIGDFKGGSARVTCAYPSDTPAHVWYLKEDGEMEALPSYYDSVKKEVVFVVEHFSHYVIEGYDVNGYQKCPQDENCVYAYFTDIDPKAWYHSGVHFCVENFLMIGMAENIFSPDTKTTRGQIVTILHRLSGLPKAMTECPFEDVAEGSYYEEAIAWAAETGVVEGYSDEKFGPNDPITREQLAKILYFYDTKFKGNTDWKMSGKLAFTDSAKVHDWAYEAMCWATDNGIIDGVAEGILEPQSTAIRVQAACMIQRYCSLH